MLAAGILSHKERLAHQRPFRFFCFASVSAAFSRVQPWPRSVPKRPARQLCRQLPFRRERRLTVDISAGETVLAEIPAQGKRIFTIAACAGCFAEVLIEQLHESMPMAILSGPGIVGPLSRLCDAGIHSVVRIPFIAPQSANYELEIHLARPSSEAVRITLAASRPAAASDRDVVAAYDAMARAEGLRRASAPDTAAKAIASYDQTIQLARETGDPDLQQKALDRQNPRVSLQAGRLHHRPQDGAAGQRSDGEPGWQSAAKRSRNRCRYMEGSVVGLLFSGPLSRDDRRHQPFVGVVRQARRSLLAGNSGRQYRQRLCGDRRYAARAVFGRGGAGHCAQTSDDDGITFSQATIAAIHLWRGEYQAAFDADEAALEEMRIKPYPDEEGQVWLNLAEIYDELNDFERERDALERSLPLVRQSGDTASESTALEDLSILDLREGRSREAAESLGQSMHIAQTHSLLREEAMAWLGKADLLAAEHEVPQALAAADIRANARHPSRRSVHLRSASSAGGRLACTSRRCAGCHDCLSQGGVGLVGHSQSGACRAGARQHGPA